MLKLSQLSTGLTLHLLRSLSPLSLLIRFNFSWVRGLDAWILLKLWNFLHINFRISYMQTLEYPNKQHPNDIPTGTILIANSRANVIEWILLGLD